LQNNDPANFAPEQQLSILIADDSPDDSIIIRLAFEEASVAAQLHFVETGEEVVSFLQRSLDATDDRGESRETSTMMPNLLLLDLKMPRMDGFEVLAWLRHHPPVDHIPVIVFSGSDQPVDINRALALGAARYLVKPQKMSDMVQLVRGIEKFWHRFQAESPRASFIAS
jgi:CheY-like chemotaxis protein